MDAPWKSVAALLAMSAVSVWAAGAFSASSNGSGAAFVPGVAGQQPQRSVQALAGTPQVPAMPAASTAPLASFREAFGTRGLMAYGMTLGVVAALVRGANARISAQRSVARRAADIEVAEKTEIQPASYLENIPRTIIEKKDLDKLLSTLPREQWDDPPEDSYLYVLKLYAETYGEGKATKMGWWDYFYLRRNALTAEDLTLNDYLKWQYDLHYQKSLTGQVPLQVPGPAGWVRAPAVIQWRGKERFAGDQCRTPVSKGGFAQKFLKSWAWYREGLKPWQRGLEIGMGHGYFLVGPFTILGPLHLTPEAATVGLLDAVAIIGLVTTGALITATTVRPGLFDEKDDEPGAGFTELVQWHAIGGIGGAAFAHILLTVFG